MILGQLELIRALAEDNEREQQLGSLNTYAYPQSLGGWLGTAVQLAGRSAGRRITRCRRSPRTLITSAGSPSRAAA